MTIEYFHASKYGNGVIVANEFQKQMLAKGVTVNVHHIREIKPQNLPFADVYVFSSPGRLGKPRGVMRRFIRKIKLPTGTLYALLATQAKPRPNPKTGLLPTDEELSKWQQIIPVMSRILNDKGLLKIAECKIQVTDLKGPLEEGWEKQVGLFASQIV